MPVANKSLCASKLAVIKAPYECPPTTTFSRSAKPRSTAKSIAASADDKIRAFDQETGKVLWEADLPASGFATPSVYSVGGRQYVVIACGGGKVDKPSSDEFVAFALPESVLKR